MASTKIRVSRAAPVSLRIAANGQDHKKRRLETATDADLADEAAGPESIFEEMMEGEVVPVEIGEDDLARQALAAVPEDDVILEELREEEAESRSGAEADIEDATEVHGGIAGRSRG